MNKIEIPEFPTTGQIFSFYDYHNTILYIGNQSSNKIFCFDYDKKGKQLLFSQKITLDMNFYNIDMLPIECLMSQINEIAK